MYRESGVLIKEACLRVILAAFGGSLAGLSYDSSMEENRAVRAL